MSISEYFSNPQRKYNKDNFAFLVDIARVDGVISESEINLLYRIGRKIGLTDPEIEHMMHSTHKPEFVPHIELARRFDNLYQVVTLAMSDGIVDKDEMHFLKRFAVLSGFSDEEIPAMLELVMKGIREGDDEEDLFNKYRKTRRAL